MIARDVFISHDSRDAASASALCEALEAQGITCWIAPRDMIGGPYATTLVEAIAGCQVMLVVLSQRAMESEHVVKEVAQAVAEKLAIIPLRLDDAALARDLKYHLQHLHWLHATKGTPSGHAPMVIEQVAMQLALRAAEADDWRTALGGLLASIVQPRKLGLWAQANLSAPARATAEHPLRHAERVLAHAARTEQIELLLERLVELDASKRDRLDAVGRAWRAAAPPSPNASLAEPSRIPNDSRLHTQSPEPTHTSIVVDRTFAWTTLNGRSAVSNDNLAFIVHGTHHQDLDLFMRRVELYFPYPELCGRKHRVLLIERDADHTRAVTGADWERVAINATRSRTGPLSTALEDETWDQPVLLMLSAARGPFRRLDQAARDGLLQLLGTRLPKALEVADLRHPIRVLIPIEVHGANDSALVSDLHKALRARADAFTVEAPMRLTLPDWHEIEHYVAATYPELDDAAIERCRLAYEAIVGNDPAKPRLRDLADPLHHLLVELVRDARRRGKNGNRNG